MEKLMGIDSDYWNTFLGQDEGEELYRDSSRYADGQCCFVAFLEILGNFHCPPGSSPPTHRTSLLLPYLGDFC